MPGRTIATFALGLRRLYRTMHRNPGIEMHPVEFTNDPYLAARNDKCAINATMQIDLIGQCGSESPNTSPTRAPAARRISCARPTARRTARPSSCCCQRQRRGTVSRIAPVLSPGTHVTTSKNDINYVVTEYGVAQLRGKTAKQRAEALIGIAHPDFVANCAMRRGR